MFLKKMAMKYKKIFAVFAFLYSRYFAGNKFRVGRANEIGLSGALLKHCKIKIKGHDNKVIIKNMARLNACVIEIRGNDNKIVIDDAVYLNELHLHTEDNGNEISIGEHSSVQGKSHMAAIEGTRITIGKECLLSGNLNFRTGDGHSILDADGNRVNASEDITIGNHVWIGTDVVCLKGVNVPDGCVVGAGSLLNKKYEKSSIIVGVPAKTVKQNIQWCHERIKMKNNITQNDVGVL